MHISARIQATIEVIDSVLKETSLPADALLTTYFRHRRYIGSQDRRAISELFYQTLRHKILLTVILNKITGETHPSSRSLTLGCLVYLQKQSPDPVKELFSAGKYGPDPLSLSEQTTLEALSHFSKDSLETSEYLNIQPWHLQELKENYDIQELLHALEQPAPFDLRVNSLMTTRAIVQRKLETEGMKVEIGRYSPLALRLRGRRPLSQHPLWVDGSIEVQDEGSQLIASLVAASPGQYVWDYCAGAGGKTLAIAATMLNQGRIIATDTIFWRLQRSQERLKRAGVHNVECHILNETTHKWVKRQQKKFDRVLTDVPCSGSGTWRRNPDLKWRLNESGFQELLQLQADILKKAAKLVKPGGRLIYSTCSVFKSENQSQIDIFLKDHQEFSLVPIESVWQEVFSEPCPTSELTLQLRPDKHGVDGFFVAVMVLHRSLSPLENHLR